MFIVRFIHGQATQFELVHDWGVAGLKTICAMHLSPICKHIDVEKWDKYTERTGVLVVQASDWLDSSGLLDWIGANIHFASLVNLASGIVASHDPNDKLGPAGYGDDGFIAADEQLAYTVRFENDWEATASARRVTIVDQLDVDLDWTTFEQGKIDFGENVIQVPPGLTHFETTLAVDGWTWNATEGWHQAKSGSPSV